MINRRKIHIEWGDCDPAQIVYYPRYLEYFDSCTAALFAKVGLSKREMLKTYGIVGIPLVELRSRFIAPSHFSEDVVVESQITEWRNSSFCVQHKLLRVTFSRLSVSKPGFGLCSAQLIRISLKDGPSRAK